jgi:putative peptidoglycan lipid II flippase
MGIALATSLAAIINSSFLFYFLRLRGFYKPRNGWQMFALRIGFSNAILGIWLWFASGELNDWLTNSAMWRLSHLAFLLITAALIYFASLWLSGIRIHDLLMPTHAEPAM